MKYHNIEPKDNMKVDKPKEEVGLKERPKMNKIISSTPIKPKRGLIRRLLDGMLGPDGFRRIGEYVGQDIIIPAVKNVIADSVKSTVEMALFGESKPSNRNTYTSARDSVRYVQPKTDYTNRHSVTKPVERTVRTNFHVKEYVITDRFEAAEVLNTLIEAADMYNSVSLADYYDMIGVEPDFTAENYGWTIDTIIKATILPTRGGYIIRFPQLEVID